MSPSSNAGAEEWNSSGPAERPASHRAGRIGLWTLGLGLAGFALWAAFAPLDEGVPSQGSVTIDTKRKAVQHLSGGIVRQVLVKEGDRVREGQTLFELDVTSAKANYEAVRQRYLNLRATQSRLLAEQAGAATIAFHADVQAAASDPLIRQQMATQVQLLASRRGSLQSELRMIEAGIAGQQAMLVAYEGMLTQRQAQSATLQDQLRHIRDLVKEAYAPRNQQLDLERLLADSAAALAELKGNQARTLQAVAEAGQRLVLRQQDYRKDVETQLSDITREVLVDAERLQALRAELARTEVKAPAAGQVVGLAIQTVGAVVQPGQKLLDVVPEDELLLLEAKIAPHLIDKVRADLPVDVRFSAFAHTPQLVVAGQVQSVSKDLLTEQQGSAVISYYLARVAITADGMKSLGQRQLQPGMPAEMVIRTGERSLLTYLLNPLTKRLAASLKEE